MKTKKVKQSGRFGVRYGKVVKGKVNAIEAKQKKKQKCPYCSKLSVKRKSKGVFHCLKCGKEFTGGAYYLNE